MSELFEQIILTSQIFFSSLFCIVGVIANGFVIYVIVRSKTLKTRRNFFMLSVSVADLLVSIPGVPLNLTSVSKILIFFQLTHKNCDFIIQEITGYPHDRQVCLFFKSFQLAQFATSMFSIVAITVDRYLAICRPMSYCSKSTRGSKIAITFCWIFGFTLGFLPFFGWNSGLTSYKCDIINVIDLHYFLYVCAAFAIISNYCHHSLLADLL